MPKVERQRNAETAEIQGKLVAGPKAFRDEWA